MTKKKAGPLKDKGLESEDVGEMLNEYLASAYTEEMEDTRAVWTI